MLETVQKHLRAFRSKLDRFPVLHDIESKTGIAKENFAFAVICLLGIGILYSVGISFFSSLIGFVYPAFKSFQTIENKVRGDDTQWLVYWILFAFFNILEHFADVLLYWIPFYFAFKMAFLAWLMLPQTKGATFLYDSFLKDFLKKNESRIDVAMNDAKKQASSMANEFSMAAEDISKKAAQASDALNQAKDFSNSTSGKKNT